MQSKQDLAAAITHLDEAYTLLWDAGFKNEASVVHGCIEQILEQIPEEDWPD